MHGCLPANQAAQPQPYSGATGSTTIGILRALGIFGSGLAGLALAIAYVTTYLRER
ncbi:hypothetical protein R2B67_16275 [Streptomyces cyaneofuscatus]|uniref:hypothetical protein n=1 Tax=Streptomyces cyaneofuscatus TaxID=66883 RepID=UPI002953F1FC|nr:hypothetical protein [Streptomyces cyaneofuscatus]WOP10016.1 hypothetical protein R2B67_16275 [Streptomyces cyaneofuscatus]